MSQTEIVYHELTESTLTKTTESDVNRLLPQLAPYAEHCTEERLREILRSNTRIFTALDGDQIVGVVLVCSVQILVGQKNWIEDLVVDQAYRGRGIASRLLDMAENAAKEGGAQDVNLTSNRARVTARQMYQKRGYQVRDSDLFRKTF